MLSFHESDKYMKKNKRTTNEKRRGLLAWGQGCNFDSLPNSKIVQIITKGLNDAYENPKGSEAQDQTLQTYS
eukprot:3130171-Amphidinium_carterae.2